MTKLVTADRACMGQIIDTAYHEYLAYWANLAVEHFEDKDYVHFLLNRSQQEFKKAVESYIMAEHEDYLTENQYLCILSEDEYKKLQEVLSND